MLLKTPLTILLLLITGFSIFSRPKDNFYNVKEYGAKGDGKNLDSKAINRAIENASLKGGGTASCCGKKI